MHRNSHSGPKTAWAFSIPGGGGQEISHDSVLHLTAFAFRISLDRSVGKWGEVTKGKVIQCLQDGWAPIQHHLPPNVTMVLSPGKDLSGLGSSAMKKMVAPQGTFPLPSSRSVMKTSSPAPLWMEMNLPDFPLPVTHAQRLEQQRPACGKASQRVASSQ